MAAGQSVVEQFWPLAVTGTFALVGVALGKVWERRGGHAAWLRDQRLAAYAEFQAACHSCWIQAMLTYPTPMEDESRSSEVGKLWRLLADVTRCQARIVLIGPDRVAQAAPPVSAALEDLVGNVQDGCGDWLGATSEARHLVEAMEVFQRVAQRVFR